MRFKGTMELKDTSTNGRVTAKKEFHCQRYSLTMGEVDVKNCLGFWEHKQNKKFGLVERLKQTK